MRNIEWGQMCMIRGPKKKGVAKKDDGPVSEDILNIWKDRTDPEIKEDDREYPLWLFKLARSTASLDHYNRSWGSGDSVNYPDVEEASIMITQLKKSKIKSINWLQKENKSTIEQNDEIDDYRGEDRMNKGMDEEEMLRLQEEQELLEQLEEGEGADDENLTKKERYEKQQAILAAQERLAALQGKAAPKKDKPADAAAAAAGGSKEDKK